MNAPRGQPGPSGRPESRPPERPEGGAIAAFFDVDGTLITGHMYSEIVKLRLRSAGWWRAAWYLSSHLALVPFQKAGLIQRRRFFMSWTIDLAGVLGGMSIESGDALFAGVAERLLATARADTLALLKEHQKNGDMLILVSGVFQPLLDKLAAGVGVSHAVGTPLEVKGGKYTGRLAGPMTFGEEKATRSLAYIRARGLEIVLGRSYAYADRIYDVPFLQMVGHPCVVYPDSELLAQARERGWRVIGQ